MSELIREFTAVNQYGNRNAIVKIGSRYTTAIYNKHHSNWTAGNAIGSTATAAVEYANYDTLDKYRTIKAAIKSITD